MSAAELDSMDKKELIIRYMTLKQRVHTQSTEIGDCRVKITNLRSELLKQSENRKEHEEMKKAHMAQARALQSMQVKCLMIIISSHVVVRSMRHQTRDINQ